MSCADLPDNCSLSSFSNRSLCVGDNNVRPPFVSVLLEYEFRSVNPVVPDRYRRAARFDAVLWHQDDPRLMVVNHHAVHHDKAVVADADDRVLIDDLPTVEHFQFTV